MKRWLPAMSIILAACGQSPITTQATNVNGPATAVASTPATPGIEESEASRQIRAAKAAETYMPKSYDNYPAYLRYWAHAVDRNDVLCFGGNSDIETTRKNCTDRDGMISFIKLSGWCRKGEVGKEIPSWYVCGPLKPKKLDLSDPTDDQPISHEPDNSMPLDANGKEPIWNTASHAWEEAN